MNTPTPPEQPTPEFAGWFRSVPSAMSYRLWEQGWHEQRPGDVALYTAPQASPVRMLTDKECEQAWIERKTQRDYPQSLQRKFCEVNGLTIQGGEVKDAP